MRVIGYCVGWLLAQILVRIRWFGLGVLDGFLETEKKLEKNS